MTASTSALQLKVEASGQEDQTQQSDVKRSPPPFRKKGKEKMCTLNIFWIFIFNTPKSYLSTSIITDSGSISVTSIFRDSHCLDYHGKIIITIDS